MSGNHVHRITSTDGTEIAGRVEGRGKNVLLLHGLLCDGDIWTPLIQHLTNDYTCHLVDMRGRGMSGTSSDLSSASRVRDVIAYAESIGEPVVLAGHSLGGRIALRAAAETSAVSAVAAYEPAVPEVLNMEGSPNLGAAFAEMAEFAAKSELTEAAKAFFSHITEPDELAALRGAGLLERTGPNVPIDMKGMQQDRAAKQPPLEATLQQVSIPVLLLKGSQSVPWFHNGNRYVAERVPDAEERTVDGCGHFGLFFAPSETAAELRSFLGALH